MANSQNVWAWSTTAADNDDADSAITWVEGQDPGTVNNSARAMMAAQKRMANAQSGNVTVGSGATVNDITIGTGQGIDTTHQALGFRVCFKAAATNTGAVTVAVDGLSAVAVQRPNGDALSADDIVSGAFYDIAFDGTNYKLLNPNSGAGAETLELISTDAGAAAGPTLSLYRNSATPAADDLIGQIAWYGEDSAGNKQQYAADGVQIKDATSASEDAYRVFSVTTAGTLAAELVLSGAALFPVVNDGLALGTAAANFSDLFLASGGVINFANGDMTITHFPSGGGGLVVEGGVTQFVRDGANVPTATVMRVQRSDCNDGDADYELIDFWRDSLQCGSITITGVPLSGSVTYNTTSDGRRKPVEHRRPIDDSGAIIDALNPVRYRWEDSDEDRIGFIAQEVVKVLPQSVKRGDDDPDKRPGDEGYQGWEMAVGSMEALLVAEIKALRARVAALEANADNA